MIPLRVVAIATVFLAVMSGSSIPAHAKCQSVMPFLALAAKKDVRVLRVKILAHARGKIECQGGGVCDAPFMAAEALVFDDLEGTKAGGRALITREPEAYYVERLAVGTEAIVAAGQLPLHAGADLLLPGCAESALPIVEHRMVPMGLGTLAIDELRAALARR